MGYWEVSRETLTIKFKLPKNPIYRGFNDLHRVSVYRSQAWIDQLMPDFNQGYSSLMDFLQQSWHSENPKAVQVAIEVSRQLGRTSPDWASKGLEDIIGKLSLEPKYSESVSNDLETRFRILEHFNAIHRAREEGEKGFASYQRASHLLGNRDNKSFGLGESTFDKALGMVKNALESPDNKARYSVPEMPPRIILQYWMRNL